MKKILITLLGLSISSIAYAGTSSANFNITGTLASNCTTSFTGATSTLSALVAGAASTATNTYNIQCTPGISTLAISATSTNSWRLISALTTPSATYISYTLAPTSAPPTGFAATWSGTPGTATPVDIVTTATQPVFASYDTPVTIPVTVTTQSVPAGSNAGNYSDTVTLATSF
jgi:hypothetical protein